MPFGFLVSKTQPQIAMALAKRKAWLSARGLSFKIKIPRFLHPVGIEREYYRDLSKRFSLLNSLVQLRLINRLPELLRTAQNEISPFRLDAFSDDLKTLLDGILVVFGRDFTEDERKRIAKQQARQAAEFNRTQNDKAFGRTLEVNVFRNEPQLSKVFESFAAENAALIKSLSERHIDAVRAIVLRSVRTGLPAKEVEKLIRKRIGKTDANLKLIARDQISKLNGQLTRIRQQEVGVTRYIWRTSLDERVRFTHRVKEGKTFSWDKPPIDTGHPGEDFQCRCYAEPILEDLLSDENS